MSTITGNTTITEYSECIMLKTCIEQLIERRNLTAKMTEKAFDEMITDANPIQMTAFLVLMRAKQETAEEIFGMVRSLQKHMLPIAIEGTVLDIVGTGGDGAQTVNISTAASILAASCGVRVVKHGGRAVSSQCGSSNVLDALGVFIDMTPQQVKQCVREVGIGFCFAPSFHPGWVKVRQVRAGLGIRTVFNLLGPLVNPASANRALIGVFNEELLPLFADILLHLNITHALVVHGNGLDELNLLGPNRVIEVSSEGKKEFILDPKDYGFSYCRLEQIQGGDAKTNANLLLKTFRGKRGPIADTIILNAGAALYVANKAASIREGIKIAQEKLYQGVALNTLNNWINFCRRITYA